ncbi:hypothetical protein BO71DRAFT_435939 [Aspergillus ellipticus CBS 707.79]|uniref:Uncharacterized protein n=1 Tax=Aspergillus ellipticus CBS 707.79 TaxID=1448320 RepID=A0A319D0Z5_9EURO|nr:hypothetical protein BO71DRAFT_435939 [Aspergillus ellipticus CBS 707.79]
MNVTPHKRLSVSGTLPTTLHVGSACILDATSHAAEMGRSTESADGLPASSAGQRRPASTTQPGDKEHRGTPAAASMACSPQPTRSLAHSRPTSLPTNGGDSRCHASGSGRLIRTRERPTEGSTQPCPGGNARHLQALAVPPTCSLWDAGHVGSPGWLSLALHLPRCQPMSASLPTIPSAVLALTSDL